jgi:putative transferase (TIGR04331 family)
LTSYLITTTDRSRWPNSGHLVFIGTFCLPDEPDSLLDRYTYEIADTSVSPEDKLRCFQVSLTSHTRLSSLLGIGLNDAHQLDRSDRHWKILTGTWLRLFVDLLVSRIFTITALRATHPNLQLVAADESIIRRTPFSTADFHTLTKFAEWNSLIYSDLWDFARTQLTSATLSHQRIESAKPELQLSKLSGFVLSATYLPRIQEVLLQLRLGAKPRRLQVIAPPEATVDSRARQQLLLDDSDTNEMEQILIKFLRTYLPTSFLEGFTDLRKSTHLMRFPNNPKAIFTSNRHIYDDVFNVWVADITENGSRLILGQHGGHYGISRFPSFAERHECDIADTYLTWGASSCRNATPAIILTILGKRRPLRKGSKLVLITDHLWSQKRSQFIDIDQTSNYTNHINEVVNSLPLGICSQLIIRTHHGQDETGRPIVDKSRVNKLGITVDDGTTAYSRLLRKSRIVVVAHNGTTFPETLSLGVPTLITWTSNWVEIRDEAKPIFAKLAEVGIFHEDPVSLAKHVSAIWDNVDAWWDSKEVVEARELFCSQYARSVPHPRKFLREIIVGKSTMEQQGDL